MAGRKTAFLLERELPPALQVVAVQLLCAVFARAFRVVAPDIISWTRTQAAPASRPDLWAFREFSSACMEAALVSPGFTEASKQRLFQEAEKLGAKVRTVLAPRKDQLADLITYLYRLIEIEVSGSVPGSLVFSRCYFSEGYSPKLCEFMSSFDSGFIAGLCAGDGLEFCCRITSGAPCCEARLLAKEEQ